MDETRDRLRAVLAAQLPDLPSEKADEVSGALAQSVEELSSAEQVPLTPAARSRLAKSSGGQTPQSQSQSQAQQRPAWRQGVLAEPAKKEYQLFYGLDGSGVETTLSQYSGANRGWTVHSLRRDEDGFTLLLERDASLDA